MPRTRGGPDLRVDGEVLPRLTLGMCLWLKGDADFDEWDAERLRALRGQALPELETPPEFILRERLRRGR